MLNRLACLLVTFVVGLSGVALLSSSPASAATVTTSLRTAIRNLPVAYETPRGYARSKFHFWIDANGDCQNTRTEVLVVESRVRPTGRCTLSQGRWRSYYDGRVYVNASHASIDRVVSLAEAWRSGGRRWSVRTRQAYANDLGDARVMNVISARSKRAKAGRDPSRWMPRYSRCRYIRQVVAVKVRWRLSVNPLERNTLARWGARCPNSTLRIRRAPITWASWTQPSSGTGSTTDQVKAPEATGPDLYVYGHSWTTGYGLDDKSVRYTRQVATALGLRFSDDVTHSRGVNGAKTHEVLARLYGGTSSSAARWDTGTDGVVLIEALLNSLRDQGDDPGALETSRQALRTMLATLNASERIEQDDPRLTLSGTWSTSARRGTASGGTWAQTGTAGGYAQWTAVGGEYVALRGQDGAGATASLTDQVTGDELLEIDTSDRIDPLYGDSIGYVVRVPASAAGHQVRLTRTGGGVLGLDAVLPTRSDLQKVIVVKEPYVDWSASDVYTKGTDAVCDLFNALVDEAAREFPNVIVVDPNGSGLWNRSTDLQTSGVGPGTHPNELGSRHMAQAVLAVLPSA